VEWDAPGLEAFQGSISSKRKQKEGVKSQGDDVCGGLLSINSSFLKIGGDQPVRGGFKMRKSIKGRTRENQEAWE